MFVVTGPPNKMGRGGHGGRGGFGNMSYEGIERIFSGNNLDIDLPILMGFFVK